MKSRLIFICFSFLGALLALAAMPWQAAAGYPAVPSGGGQPAPGDWPMYGHDYQHTSYNPDESIIGAGNVTQLVPRWRVNIGTNGTMSASSAPSVANGKVYVGSSVASGDNFFGINAISGTQVWTASLGYNPNPGCLRVGLGSTAAISGTVISVGGGDSAYYGLNADTGQQLWRDPMDLGPSAFAWESPLMIHGRAYLGMSANCDNPSVRGEVRAVDMLAGARLQSQYFVPEGLRGAGIWNSPALSPDGNILFITTGEDYGGYNGPYNRAMVAMDAITLQILKSNQQGNTGGDVDYATSPTVFSDSQGRLLVGALHKNRRFYAFDFNDTRAGWPPIWEKLMPSYSAGMLHAYDPNMGDGGTLFLTVGTTLYALDPATGAERWTAPITGGYHGNMAVANDLIFINSGAAGLKIYSETNGALLNTLMPANPGASNAGIAVSHGFVYWVSGSYINAWSLPEGTTVTPGTTATPIPATPTRTPTPPPPTATIGTPVFSPTPTRPTSTPTLSPTLTPTVPTATSTPQCGPAWREVPPPSDGQLYGVAAVAPDDAWATGNANNEDYIYHWDGLQWNTAQGVNSTTTTVLQSIEAVSQDDVWAVGFYFSDSDDTFIEHWNGSTWEAVPSPNGSGEENWLVDISAVASDDVWAVGMTTNPTELSRTLILHWDGTAWSVVASPNMEGNGWLNGVSARAANDVWAVGNYRSGNFNNTLAMHWDGVAWSVVPSPNPNAYNYLEDVAAVGPDDVWAVGSTQENVMTTDALLIHWDGDNWNVENIKGLVQAESYLVGIDAVSSTDAWAVGNQGANGSDRRTLIARWDGVAWSVWPSPGVGTYSTLNAVSAASTTDIWAVGYGGSAAVPLTMRYFEPCATPTPLPTSTFTPTPTASSTPTATATGTGTPTAISTNTSVATNTIPVPTACTISFNDVPQGSTFYPFVRCLACKGILGGYADGTFRPNNEVTRGQLSKIVANSAGFNEPASGQTFEDVPPGSTFHLFVERLLGRGIIGGYPCGGASEPCGSGNRPYFRPGANATRGQISKIVSESAHLSDPVSGQTYEDVPPTGTFYLWIERLSGRGIVGGYACGGTGEPCGTGNRPYFRPNNNATRGQTSKIVANTFFPNCNPPMRR
jgi:outer membrane protein assembly factor BamB